MNIDKELKKLNEADQKEIDKLQKETMKKE